MMRSALAATVLLLLAVPCAFSAGVKVTPTHQGKETRISVTADRAPAVDVLQAIGPYLDRPMAIRVSRSVIVSYVRTNVSPAAALKEIVDRAQLMFGANSAEYLVWSKEEPVVTLDVKDMPVREILQSIQKQCGIRNLIVDPDVQGSGTFLFHDLPCSSALKTVMKTLGLASETDPNSLVQVSTADHAGRR